MILSVSTSKNVKMYRNLELNTSEKAENHKDPLEQYYLGSHCGAREHPGYTHSQCAGVGAVAGDLAKT